METEIWKDIEGFIGRYQISNAGRIRSIMFNNEKILTPCLDSKGYFYIGLYKNKKRKMFRIHRIIAFNFIKNNENKKCINHKNGIKTDNRIENLEWCTYSENLFHAYEMGLRKKL